MHARRASISDVARHAGVSKATVSAVINDSGPVGESTRARVRAAIEALNYRRAPVAGAASASSRSRCLALVIKELDNPYYGEVIAGARTHAAQNGYTLLVVSSEGDYDAEQRAVAALQAKDVDGLIVTPVLGEDADLSHLFELKRHNFPFVLLEAVRGVQASLVDVDNIEGARMAVAHLIALGHRRIVHFAGPAYSSHSAERVDGVRRECSASRLVFGDEQVVLAGAHLDDGYRCGLAYFGARERADRPTAVTCYNDLVALGLCRALTELGLRVPDDVSVVGFDDIPLLAYLPLALTTVRIPKAEMGRLATQMLIRHVESKELIPPRKVYLPAELVVRQSTAAPRHPSARSSTSRSSR